MIDVLDLLSRIVFVSKDGGVVLVLIFHKASSITTFFLGVFDVPS